MRKTIKGLESEIKELKSSIKFWENKYRESDREAQRLKLWIKTKLDWWLDLLEKSERPCLKYLVKNAAELLGMK